MVHQKKIKIHRKYKGGLNIENLDESIITNIGEMNDLEDQGSLHFSDLETETETETGTGTGTEDETHTTSFSENYVLTDDYAEELLMNSEIMADHDLDFSSQGSLHLSDLDVDEDQQGEEDEESQNTTLPDESSSLSLSFGGKKVKTKKTNKTKKSKKNNKTNKSKKTKKTNKSKKANKTKKSRKNKKGGDVTDMNSPDFNPNLVKEFPDYP